MMLLVYLQQIRFEGHKNNPPLFLSSFNYIRKEIVIILNLRIYQHTSYPVRVYVLNELMYKFQLQTHYVTYLRGMYANVSPSFENILEGGGELPFFNLNSILGCIRRSSQTISYEVSLSLRFFLLYNCIGLQLTRK